MTDWKKVALLEDIPKLGSRVVMSNKGDIALFRTAEDEVFALHDRCPHKGGPLSQGIVHGRKVSCPLHGWNINLVDGSAVEPDIGCAIKLSVKLENGEIYIKL